ncbi:hypothetical protein V5052_08830 [Klebsiella variicola]|uniref:hypothetical protein n=1 Tax=Klebsiella variicola TaxID=244366 RepID=UPI00316D3E47
MGRVERLLGVSAVNTGKKLYREKTINAGTRALFDMSLDGFGGAADVVAGGEIKSLSYEDAVGVFNKPHAYSNGGMIYARTANDGFDLPSEASPQPGDRHWLFTTWLKITNPGNAGFNNQVMHFATSGLNVPASTMLSLVPTVVVTDDVTSVTTIEMRVRAKNIVLTSQLKPLFDGAVHQLAVENEMSADFTQQRIFVYLDKSLIYSSGWVSAAAAAPEAPTIRRVGSSSSMPVTWGGTLYRVRSEDLTLTTLTAAEIAVSDYDNSRSRFS